MRRGALAAAVLFLQACASGPERLPAGQPWQWQLTGTVDATVDVPIYDVDGFDTPESLVEELHADGRFVICYFSAGSYEGWRPDAAAFPEEVKGRPLEGFRDERWLDIRRLDVLGPILESRLDMCREKGFDAVEPDNVDGYANPTGFPLTAEDQLTYNRWLASQAHERGLSIGLKNDLDQVPDLVDDFDWALNEQCLEYGECDRLLPFSEAGKAVLHVEYHVDLGPWCPESLARGWSSMEKRIELDAWRRPCTT